MIRTKLTENEYDKVCSKQAAAFVHYEDKLELAKKIAEASDISPKQLERVLKENKDRDFLESEVRECANHPDIKYLKQKYMIPSSVPSIQKALGAFVYKNIIIDNPFDRKNAKLAAYQAVLGDIAGSFAEFSSVHYDKDLFDDKKYFTDDTVLSLSTIDAIDKHPRNPDFLNAYVNATMKYPDAGYGGSFIRWAQEVANGGSTNGYSSAANGCLMRIGYIPFYYKSYRKAVDMAIKSCMTTHNHVASVKAVIIYVTCCFLGLAEEPKSGIRAYVKECYANENEYNSLWRHHYTFGETLEESLELNKKLPGDSPLFAQYQMCFVTDVICSAVVEDTFDADGKCCGNKCVTNWSFEDVLKSILRIGGDTDTAGAIAGPLCYSIWRKECFDTMALLKRFKVPYDEDLS